MRAETSEHQSFDVDHEGEGAGDDLDVPRILKEFEREAGRLDLLVWRNYPGPMPTVGHGEDVSVFLDAAARLDAKVVYLMEWFGRDGSLLAFQAGFALHGVLHEIEIGDEAPYELDPMPGLHGPFGDDPAEQTLEPEPAISWGEREYLELDDTARAAVDALLADPRYEGHGGASLEALAHHGAGFADEAYSRMKQVAQRRYFELVEVPMRDRAQRLAAELVSLPDLDPLEFHGQAAKDFVAGHVTEEDPRFIRVVARQMSQLIWESGLHDRARDAVERDARELLGSLPLLVRDRVCFASRVGARESLLRPYADGREDRLLTRIAALIGSVEAEPAKRARESRYASATRELLAAGTTKASVSRSLGISTSVIDRILREYPDAPKLSVDDPIVTDLLPHQLGGWRTNGGA